MKPAELNEINLQAEQLEVITSVWLGRATVVLLCVESYQIHGDGPPYKDLSKSKGLGSPHKLLISGLKAKS